MNPRTIKSVKLDPEDEYLLAKYSWSIQSKGYAQTIVCHDKKPTAILMHRVIMNAPKSMWVDHINGDTLDNRRSNLRLCTSSQNHQNCGKQINNKTGYKGVCGRLPANKKFLASIQSNYKLYHLGLYETPRQAAIAYNNAAILLHGKFAHLNEIPPE